VSKITAVSLFWSILAQLCDFLVTYSTNFLLVGIGGISAGKVLVAFAAASPYYALFSTLTAVGNTIYWIGVGFVVIGIVGGIVWVVKKTGEKIIENLDKKKD
jgi:hypothetical protein